MAHFLGPKVSDATPQQLKPTSDSAMSPKTKAKAVKAAHYLPPKVSETGAQLLESTPEPAPLPKLKLEAPQAPKPQPNLTQPRKSASKATSESLEKHQRQKERQGRQRATSLGGWVKNIFPSQRPERGGTYREQGYWEEIEAKDKAEGRSRRRVTDSHHSLGDESVNSNRIVRWNTAKELSERPSYPIQPRRRAVSTAQGALSLASNGGLTNNDRVANNDQRWSWTLWEDSEDQISVTKLGGILQNGGSKGINTSNIIAGTMEPTDWAVPGGRPSQMHELFKASLEGRRQRQRLKKRGDYLGVQGINPQTGQLDVMTPTDSSATSQERQRKIDSLRNMLRNSRHSFGRPATRREESRTSNEEEKFLRLQKEKQKIRDLSKSVKWRRHRKQWSSAQEPDLSPISQSLKSASSGSGRQSHGQIHKPAGPPREGRLVDISPLKPHRSTLQLHLLDEMIARSPDSSNTIIRTPHRRSVANTSPTAWELFENGISFNDSDAPNTVEQNKTAVSPAAIQGREYAKMNQPPHQMPPASLPLVEVTPLGKTTVKPNDWIDANDEQSFLGLQAVRPIDPGGAEESITTHLASETHHLSQLFPMKARHSSNLTHTMNGNHPKVEIPLSPDRDTADCLIMHTPRTMPVQVTVGEPKMQTLLEKKLLRKTAPRLAYLKRKRNTERDQQEIHQMGNVVQTPHSYSVNKPVTKRPVGPDKTPLLKDKMEKDILILKQQVPILDNPESVPLHQSLNQCLTDHGWIDSTIHDITTKADEVKLSAFTPIITTTGCDRQTYPLNVSEAMGKPGECQRQLYRRLLSAQGEVVADQLCNTSLKSTSIQHRVQIHNCAGDQHSHKKQKQGQKDVRQQTTHPKDRMAESKTGRLSARLRSPGSYPAPLDVEDDTESHSSSEPDDRESFKAKWTNFREEWRQKQIKESTSQIIIGYGIALLRLYWAFVWPVLDPRTLWMEHEESMSPVTACFMIMLATPAAILGSVILVQAMKLVALMWAVLEWVFD